MLKTVLAAKTMFVDERTNVLVIRDTPDVVRMAEKLVASLDVAEPEVMLEVEVPGALAQPGCRISAIQYPTSATFTPQHVCHDRHGRRRRAGCSRTCRPRTPTPSA